MLRKDDSQRGTLYRNPLNDCRQLQDWAANNNAASGDYDITEAPRANETYVQVIGGM